MKNLIVFIPMFLVGCNTNQKVQLTDCKHPSGYCKEIREVSELSWKYALLSNNVYKDKKQFNVNGLFTQIAVQENKALDYYSELHRDMSTGEFIMVFRGTDSIKDFQTGNRIFNQKQNKYALELYDKLKQIHQFDSLIVTGHSLGGGIATHLSLNRPKTRSFIFNSSPIFRKENGNIANERHSIVEKGEILKITRIFGKEATQTYTSLNCSKSNPVEQHGIQLLSNCLIKIVSYSDPKVKDFYLTD